MRCFELHGVVRSEKQVVTVQAENKKLVEPLKKAKEELHRLKGIISNLGKWDG